MYLSKCEYKCLNWWDFNFFPWRKERIDKSIYEHIFTLPMSQLRVQKEKKNCVLKSEVLNLIIGFIKVKFSFKVWLVYRDLFLDEAVCY